MQPTRALDRLKAVIFTLCGIGLLTGAAFATYGSRAFLDHTITAPGIVTTEEAGPTHVRIRFTTRTGRTLTYFQGGDILQHVGDHVIVRYDPADPTTAALDTTGATWGTPIAIGALGAIFTTVGLTLAISSFRPNPGKPKPV